MWSAWFGRRPLCWLVLPQWLCSSYWNPVAQKTNIKTCPCRSCAWAFTDDFNENIYQFTSQWTEALDKSLFSISLLWDLAVAPMCFLNISVFCSVWAFIFISVHFCWKLECASKEKGMGEAVEVQMSLTTDHDAWGWWELGFNHIWSCRIPHSVILRSLLDPN